MGHRTTRGARRQAQGPSKFFIIALAIGLVLFLVAFVVVLRRPPQPEKIGKSGAIASVATVFAT